MASFPIITATCQFLPGPGFDPDQYLPDPAWFDPDQQSSIRRPGFNHIRDDIFDLRVSSIYGSSIADETNEFQPQHVFARTAVKKVLKRFSAAGSIGILFAIATASIPFAANAAVFILGNDIDISQADANRSLFAFPDVATTPSPGGPVPIPYPVMNSIETDDSTGIKTTRVTTRISIRSEKFKRAAGDEPGLIPGVVSSDNLGFVGDILQLSWNNQVHPEETATLSLLLADPATGLAIDPDYSVDVSDSQSGGFDFDLDSLPLTVFDLVLVAEQTTDQAQPRSLISLTDIRIDGVSVAARFDVAEIPLPPALILFASGFFGLVLSQRRRHRETDAATA